MDLEKRVREDLWKSIQAHYERKDYTECIRDAIFHLCELLREKSGLYDKDGSKLVEGALMGPNPPILINKHETTTEKDIQQGVAFSLKGIMQSIRNPLSHEKTVFSQKDSEAIILYINFILNQIDHSGGVTKIDNIMELLFDDDFTKTKEYAELLLKEIPVKKRYDLLLELYNRRAQLQQHNLRNFIYILFDSLSKAAKTDFINLVSTSLMKCKDDMDLRMYCHYFMTFTYAQIDRLAQLRMEDLFLKSVNAGEIIFVQEEFLDEYVEECVSAGTLAIWINDKLDMLSNKENIIDALFHLTNKGANKEKYVFKYFINAIDNDDANFKNWQIALIKNKLNAGNEYFYDWISEKIDLFEIENYKKTFEKECEKCRVIIEERKANEGELPF